jgi:hypothetical protein
MSKVQDRAAVTTYVRPVMDAFGNTYYCEMRVVDGMHTPTGRRVPLEPRQAPTFVLHWSDLAP